MIKGKVAAFHLGLENWIEESAAVMACKNQMSMGILSDDGWKDPVIEAYKADVDRTLLRENVKLSPHERMLRLIEHLEFTEHCRKASKRQREEI